MLKFFQRKTSTIVREEWDPERKLDCDIGLRGYNFTDSVAIAVDFFFRARLGKLPEEQQRLVCIDPRWESTLCQAVVPAPIDESGHTSSRIIYIGSRDSYDKMFRVVVLRGQGKDEWRVVGFHYPRNEKDKDGESHYYAVFEPHHYWFRWWTESGYWSPMVNPSY